MNAIGLGIEAVERGLVPDLVTRRAIRRLCKGRLRDISSAGSEASDASTSRFIDSMRTGPIAPVPQKANEQHYELPPEFFELTLGLRRKYSCCFWSEKRMTLDEAEVAALRITCERAQIGQGQNILELGCGWGSLSLWMAEHYRQSQITAVSNSAPQRKHIETVAAEKGITNLQVITADMNDFDPAESIYELGQFDRVVSVEMFEHMRNYELLLKRISSWLKPDGKLFVHIFCHRKLAYPFETEGSANWMGRYFFTGGIMPSADMFDRFSQHLQVARHWKWNGLHYQLTAQAWLDNLDANRSEVLPILRKAYGDRQATRWLNRWRMFFLACSELFGYDQGEQWFVSHYLLEHELG